MMPGRSSAHVARLRLAVLLDAEGGRTRPRFRLGVGCDAWCTKTRDGGWPRFVLPLSAYAQPLDHVGVARRSGTSVLGWYRDPVRVVPRREEAPPQGEALRVDDLHRDDSANAPDERPLRALGRRTGLVAPSSARTSSSAPACLAARQPHRATAHRGGASPSACPCVRVHLAPWRVPWCASPPPSPRIRSSDPFRGPRVLSANALFAGATPCLDVLTVAPPWTASPLGTRLGAFAMEELLSCCAFRPWVPWHPRSTAWSASSRCRPTPDARRRWLGVAPMETSVGEAARCAPHDRMVLPRWARAFPLAGLAVRGR
jgi:hypothetical protein